MTEDNSYSTGLGAYSLTGRRAIRNDGLVGSIVSLIDADGDETENTEKAVTIIVHWPVEHLPFETIDISGDGSITLH